MKTVISLPFARNMPYYNRSYKRYSKRYGRRGRYSRLGRGSKRVSPMYLHPIRYPALATVLRKVVTK
jgi:hypothetical protein